MAYNRQPQSVLAGVALAQNPPASIVQPAGIVPVTLDCEIATTTSLGVVQAGTGLSITPGGILSVTGVHGCCSMNVYLTSEDYTATEEDCYIGASGHHREDDGDNLFSVVNNVVPVIPIVPVHNIEITLPRGVTGKVYIVKNQDRGNIRVVGTSGQQIDTSLFITLGSESSITVVFDGTRWNTI